VVALRVAVVLLCVAFVAWPVGHAVVVGLRTGRLPHSDSTATVARATHPLRFRALMLLFLAMLALLGYGASLGLQRALA
jgi:hypothetical protein